MRSTRTAPLTALALCAALMLAIGCKSDAEKLADHIALAAEHTANKRDHEALIEYYSALQLDPKNAEINERIAEVYRDNGAAEDAAFFYGEAYRLDPDRIDAVMHQVQLLLYSADMGSTWSGGTVETGIERAAVILEDVLERFPSVPIVQLTRSQLELMRRDTQTALTAIMTAVQLAPDDAEVWLQVGAVHSARIEEARREGSSEPVYLIQSALNAFERADQIEGGSIRAKIERARVLADWPGHEAEAEQEYRQTVALAKEGGDPDVILFAADAANQFARESRNLEMRIWALREMLAIPGTLHLTSVAKSGPRYEIRRHEESLPVIDDSRIRIWDELARLYDVRSKGGGEQIYAELLAERPDDPIANGYYANYLVENDALPRAVKHLTGVIDAGRGSPGLWEQLVQIHIDNSRLAVARDTYEKMLEVYQDEPLTRRAGARIALEEHRFEDAAETLRLLSAQTENFETLRLLSYSEYLVENLTAATVAMERALGLSGGQSPSAVALKTRTRRIFGVLRAARENDLDLALAMAEEGRRLDPSPDVLDTLGWVHLKRGETRAAVEVLEAALQMRADSPSIRYRLALALQQQGESARARDMLRIALETSTRTFPEEAAARRMLAKLERERIQLIAPGAGIP